MYYCVCAKNVLHIRDGKRQTQGDAYIHEKLYTPSSSKLLGEEILRAAMQKLNFLTQKNTKKMNE